MDPATEKCTKPTFPLTMPQKFQETMDVLGPGGENELVEVGGHDGDPNSFIICGGPDSLWTFRNTINQNRLSREAGI